MPFRQHFTLSFKIKPILPLCIIATFIAGCAEKHHAAKESIERFDTLVAEYTTLDSIKKAEFRERYADAISFITKGGSGNQDSAIEAYTHHKAMRMFGSDVKERFTMTDSIESILGEIKHNLSVELPDAKWKRIVGVISTYNQSVIMTDSTLLLGLNHYLGSDYPAYSYFEPYQRAVKTPRHLPYDVAEALITNIHPFNPGNESTLLNRILYEGAILSAVNDVVPGNDVAESMGYNSDEWKWLSENETEMWKALIDRNLLFSMDQAAVERMTRQAPASSILHPNAPGRAGRYIGFRIVQSYRKHHPEKSLEWLLSPEFYNSPTALIDSKYTP
ncbi:MAG: hypothetical protein NC216_02010 [Bacteroides sp.]|nr:hypothetical protein [Bacteroides sp.]